MFKFPPPELNPVPILRGNIVPGETLLSVKQVVVPAETIEQSPDIATGAARLLALPTKI